jgi:hypothetical protein
MDHLDDLLVGLDVVLGDDILDRIDEIVPPGTEVGALDQDYMPPALEAASPHRRPLSERAAAWHSVLLPVTSPSPARSTAGPAHRAN